MDQRTRVIEMLDELKELDITSTQADNYLKMYKGTLSDVRRGVRNLSDRAFAKLVEFYEKKTHKSDIPSTHSRWDEMERRLDAQLPKK